MSHRRQFYLKISLPQELIVWVISVGVAATGVIDMFSSTTRAIVSRRELLNLFLPTYVRVDARFVTMAIGFSLLFFAWGLRRRKRLASNVALILLLISCLTHLIKGLDYEEATLSFLFAGLLFYYRSYFQVRSGEKPGLLLVRYLVMVLLLFVFCVIEFHTIDKYLGLNLNWHQSLQAAIDLILQPQYYPRSTTLLPIVRVFFNSVLFFEGAIIGLFILTLLRPVIDKSHHTSVERAHDIIKQYGRTNLASLNLLPNRSYWFSSGGSVVSYSLKNRTAVVLGDPVGPATDLQMSIKEFNDFCAHNDWRLMFYQVSEMTRSSYELLGFRSIMIGIESYVSTQDFNLNTPQMKTVRNSVARIRRLGYTARMYEPPLPLIMVKELQQISNEWLGMLRRKEKFFSSGSFDTTSFQTTKIMVVYNREGQAVSFVSLLPQLHASSLTIDMMRYNAKAENGTMEFLMTELITWCKTHGYDSFGLGFASLSTNKEWDSEVSKRAKRIFFKTFKSFYNFEGIYKFKAKFTTKWENRYLIYRNPTNLPAALLALIRSDSGGTLW